MQRHEPACGYGVPLRGYGVALSGLDHSKHCYIFREQSCGSTLGCLRISWGAYEM